MVPVTLSRPLAISLALLAAAASLAPTAAFEVRSADEATVFVDGGTDTMEFAPGTSTPAGASIVIAAPNGATMAFVRTGTGGGSGAQRWTLGGTQLEGQAGLWTAQGSLDGQPADGTWTVSVQGYYASYDVQTGSDSWHPGQTLSVAGRFVHFQFNWPTADKMVQLWNWHEGSWNEPYYPLGATDLPNESRQEDPAYARYYSAPTGSGMSQRTLLHQEGIGIQSFPLLPIGTGAVPVPDVPPQPGQPVPDVPPTTGQPVPDHPGAGPVPTPGVGEDVGVLSTRDAGTNYCTYFTPEGGPEQLLFCVGRAFLGAADPLLPRGDTPLVFYDAPDVPATGPVTTPDVPPTSGQPTPDVPPTAGQPTPDVPAVPVGSLGDSPALSVDVDVSYAYDAARLTPLVNLLGVQVWSPVAPGDAAWLASPANPASLTVAFTVYKDGVAQGTVEHNVPFLGQALAASERTAGTL